MKPILGVLVRVNSTVYVWTIFGISLWFFYRVKAEVVGDLGRKDRVRRIYFDNGFTLCTLSYAGNGDICNM